MSKKPSARSTRSLRPNKLGLTLRDYEGAMSTLCAGCGHDSVTAAIVRAFFELDTPAAHGGQAVGHRLLVEDADLLRQRRPRLQLAPTGACRPSPPGRPPPTGQLTYIGISGDGDSLSIGLGQLCHAIRRNLNMLYVIENNGVYGLTKGQFSASADVGSKSKKGEANQMSPIDPVMLALSLGATFVARSFSGDKAQLVPLLKAGLQPQGLRPDRRDLALRDLQRSRGLDQELPLHPRAQRRGDPRPTSCRCAGRSGPSTPAGSTTAVTMHDGSVVRFTKVAAGLQPARPPGRLQLPAGPPEQGRGPHRPAVHRRHRARDARDQRHHRRCRWPRSAVREAVPGQRRPGQAAKRLPVITPSGA